MIVAAITLESFFTPLALFGFTAQLCFMMRFLVQWFVSERKGRSHVPVVFWWLSLLGGGMLFTYAFLREDPVIMAGQALGVFIYVRNLILIFRRRNRINDRQQERAAALAAGTATVTPDPANEATPTTDP